MTRGVLYIVFPGEPRAAKALYRSQQWLKKFHPDIPVEVVELAEGTLLDKARMLDLSPFDSTLFLDADTAPLGDLSFIFDKAEQFGLACAICECPWARRFGALADRPSLVEYNTGLLGFTKGAAEVFDAWKRLIDIDSSLQFLAKDGSVQTMPLNDQAAFAAAIDETGFNPFVLPMNYNFRPLWQKTVFGPIVVWHDYSDIPPGILKWNDVQSRRDAVLCCGRVP